MKKLNQNGFGAIEVLLLVVIVGIIGGAGWYVYNSQKKTNESLDNATQSLNDAAKTKQEAKKTEKQDPKEEDSWLLYTSDNKKYSLRVPDGWKLISMNNNLYARNNDFLIYKKGQKATVEPVEGGWDGPSRLAVWMPQDPSQITKDGKEVSTIKTDQGLTVHKYYYEETKDPEAIGFIKGDKVFGYYFDASGKNIVVQHVVSTGETDQSSYVERLVKTIKVN